ncbi:MAG TPA: phosphoribosylanthranilate isomerase [Vicinamibacterales bacterium]|jgi:phosphoribosylanthranilate isomerase
MTLVKICGITRLEDALDAAALGASAIGLVFWPASPRAVDPISARAIVEALPPLVTPVGVFVDQPEAEVDRIAGEVRLGAVQLHGHETPEYCGRMRRPVIKAFGVDRSFDEAVMDPYPAGVTVLLDARDDQKRGGTGRQIDWTLAARVAAKRRIMLAGGVDAGNVEDAIRTVRPFAIDVSSGVERAPGVKDHAKMQALFEAVKRC